MINDIVVAILGAIAWTGSLVLWILLRSQPQSRSLLLRRYFGIKLLAWTLLMILETVWYLQLDIITWLNLRGFDAMRQITFRCVMGLAIWMMIRDLLQPRYLSTQPIEEAQVQIDAFGIIHSWNDAAVRLFGWSAEEVLGKELAEVIVPPQYRDDHRRGLAHFRATGEAPLIDTRYTQAALTKNGAKLIVDIRITRHLTPQGTMFLGNVTPALGVQ